MRIPAGFSNPRGCSLGVRAGPPELALMLAPCFVYAGIMQGVGAFTKAAALEGGEVLKAGAQAGCTRAWGKSRALHESCATLELDVPHVPKQNVSLAFVRDGTSEAGYDGEYSSSRRDRRLRGYTHGVRQSLLVGARSAARQTRRVAPRNHFSD